ncbi:glucose-1-phosphate cytidylyltransferase [Candidatus Pelagibacter sp.]|jgi:glucose-1-phosphate cytidylyltransferase|nr:glucose-1-phosphate cytidylyltransferase [Candidatus Pelagibacter sp.]
MKTVILAGGYGTRLSEETELKPKPLVEIGGKPILWHIMKIYSSYGLNDFVICLGYKGYLIKEYFYNYFLHNSDVTIDVKNNKLKILNQKSEPWTVTLVDTGKDTVTGGRLKRVSKYLGNKDFCFTYGDGVSDVNIKKLIKFHKKNKKLATVTAIKPPEKFGILKIDKDNIVEGFFEKQQGLDKYINGGFFVLSPKVIKFISGDDISWEREPMEHLAKIKQLSSYKHRGFWHPMDTLRDKRYLEDLWSSGKANWKIWK